MPNVAVHDLVIQPVEKDLIIATHGRSIYKLNISALQNFDTNQKGEKIFKINPVNKPIAPPPMIMILLSLSCFIECFLASSIA